MLYEAIHMGTCKAVKLSQAKWNQCVAYNAARVAKGDDVYNEALSASSLGKRKLEGMREEEEEEEEGGEAWWSGNNWSYTQAFVNSVSTVFLVGREHDI